MSLIPEVGGGLYHLDAFLLEYIITAQDRIAVMLRAKYRDKILDVGAVRTGAFYDSIAVADPFFDGELRVEDVESDIYTDAGVGLRRAEGIGDIIERGLKPPRRYPGRYPAALALEEADPFIVRILQDARSFAVTAFEEASGL